MNKIDFKQQLKQHILKNQSDMLFITKQYHYKSSKDILTNIYNSNQNYKINILLQQKIKKILQKVLLQNLLYWIDYATYKNNTLIIVSKNHTAQYELNYKKIELLNIFKNFDDFKDIQKVSIIRAKQKDKIEFKFYKPKKLKENSYAIFDNILTNKKLFKKFEEIRKIIRQHNEKNNF